jgi:hypothetical protein
MQYGERSCCSAPRQTSFKGATLPKRSLPQARANCPETHACVGCVMAIFPCFISRYSMPALLSLRTDSAYYCIVIVYFKLASAKKITHLQSSALRVS